MCLNLSPLNLQKAIQLLSIKLGICGIFKLLIKYLTLQVNAKLSALLFLWLHGDLYKYQSSVSFLHCNQIHMAPYKRTRGSENVHASVRLPTVISLALLLSLINEMRMFTSQSYEIQIRQEEVVESPQSCSFFQTCSEAFLHGKGGHCQQRCGWEEACSSKTRGFIKVSKF